MYQLGETVIKPTRETAAWNHPFPLFVREKTARRADRRLCALNLFSHISMAVFGRIWPD
jgi:hypothetical protein